MYNNDVQGGTRKRTLFAVFWEKRFLNGKITQFGFGRNNNSNNFFEYTTCRAKWEGKSKTHTHNAL